MAGEQRAQMDTQTDRGILIIVFYKLMIALNDWFKIKSHVWSKVYRMKQTPKLFKFFNCIKQFMKTQEHKIQLLFTPSMRGGLIA